MGKQMLKYGAVLIGLYVVVANGTNFGSAFTQSAQGGATVIKAFQGRG
jgi:hypothetical protein